MDSNTSGFLEARPQAYLEFRSQIILWLSGLRGAIAFALALSVPILNDGKYRAECDINKVINQLPARWISSRN